MKRIDQTGRDFDGADPANFVLPARMQRLVGGDDGESVRLYRVAFEESSRTHWHTHDDEAQILFGLSGRCIVVDRAGNELILKPGDVVIIEAHEEHWHGAAPGGSGEHLAINLGTKTTWLGAD